MAELIVLSGPSKGQRFQIGNGISTIGRDQTNTIQINDFEMSRQHAELHIRQNEWLIIDLESSNGTLVNESPVKKMPLANHDQIQIGQSVLEFFTSEGSTEGSFVDNETIGLIDDPENSPAEYSDATPSHDDSEMLLKAKSDMEMLYHAAIATGSFRSTESLLQRILELVFYWISAQRTCILLKEDQQELLFAKSIDPAQPKKFSTEPFDIEYSIVKHVFRKKEGVVVDTRKPDERFPDISNNPAQDRQIICAPIKSRFGVRGVIYADQHQLPSTAETIVPFDDQQLKILIAIGLHASIAIENSDQYELMLQSERTTAVGNAMTSLSHHIKNVLQSINGGNHLIEAGLAQQQVELINNGWGIVRKNQQVLSDLVMDMLSFSKNSTPRLQPLNIVELVNELVQRNSDDAGRQSVNLHFESSKPSIRIFSDKEMLSRAVNNIVSFSVNCCRENSGGNVNISICEDAEFAKVVVDDDGVKLTHQETVSVFDPLSISEQSSRNGLGMPVAKKLIAELSGMVVAESNEHMAGNRFVLKIPTSEHLVGNGDSPTPATM